MVFVMLFVPTFVCVALDESTNRDCSASGTRKSDGIERKVRTIPKFDILFSKHSYPTLVGAS